MLPKYNIIRGGFSGVLYWSVYSTGQWQPQESMHSANCIDIASYSHPSGTAQRCVYCIEYRKSPL